MDQFSFTSSFPRQLSNATASSDEIDVPLSPTAKRPWDGCGQQSESPSPRSEKSRKQSITQWIKESAILLSNTCLRRMSCRSRTQELESQLDFSTFASTTDVSGLASLAPTRQNTTGSRRLIPRQNWSVTDFSPIEFDESEITSPTIESIAECENRRRAEELEEINAGEDVDKLFERRDAEMALHLASVTPLPDNFETKQEEIYARSREKIWKMRQENPGLDRFMKRVGSAPPDLEIETFEITYQWGVNERRATF